MRALVSTFDRTGLTSFLSDLQLIAPAGLEIISTGGTGKYLVEAGFKVIPIETVTDIPEGMGGRVKTLSHRIAAGLLHRGDVDNEYLSLVNGVKIDMVVVNFYPFEQTVASGGDFEKCVENIDIGGPTMLRAACKNYLQCLPVCSPAQYNRMLRFFKEGKSLDPNCVSSLDREQLMLEAFSLTSSYDTSIVRYLQRRADARINS